MKTMRYYRGLISNPVQKWSQEIIWTWVEWVQRVTPEARDAMRASSVPNWSEEQQRRMTRWRERLQQMETDRWTVQAASWGPVASGLEDTLARGGPTNFSAPWYGADQ